MDPKLTRRRLQGLPALALAVALAACSHIQHKPVPPVSAPALATTGPVAQGRRIAVFFDGTHNDEGSDTNVKRLHALVSLQDRPDIASLYIQGVGVGADLIGAGTGAGINARVRLAYEFLLSHYRPGDRIYLFGFSRGAYSARQLTAMLYQAGLPIDRGAMSPGEVSDLVQQAVLPQQHADRHLIRGEARWHWARERLAASPLGHASEAGRRYRADEVDIEVLGLWDTVEALGVPDYPARLAHRLHLAPLEPNVDEANARYGDRLCNVRHAFQALSIDDNREWIFTPLLLTRQYLFEGCVPGRANPLLDGQQRVRPGHLQEVWFSGAHADVGGGYADTALSGVSLNWMIQRLIQAEPPGGPGLLPAGSRVRQDVHGSSHDAEQGTAGGLAYHAAHRNLVRYALGARQAPEAELQQPLDAVRGTLCVHGSVFERRALLPLRAHENPQLRLIEPGPVCLSQQPRPLDADWLWWAQAPAPAGSCAQSLLIERYPDCRLITPQEH